MGDEGRFFAQGQVYCFDCTSTGETGRMTRTIQIRRVKRKAAITESKPGAEEADQWDVNFDKCDRETLIFGKWDAEWWDSPQTLNKEKRGMVKSLVRWK